MFLLDIQRGQADGVRAFLARSGARRRASSQLIPVLRARVVGVSGRETNLDELRGGARSGGSLAREYTITYRDHLEANERIIDGAFWNGPSAEPEVSVEREHRTSGSASTSATRCGSTSSAAIVSARVTSIRDVEWRDSRNGGFMFVFRPGALDQAPQTFVRRSRARRTPPARGRFQHDLVDAVPERVGDRLPRDPRDASAT